MAQEGAPMVLTGLSAALAGVVEQVAPSVVRVDDGSRLTATGLIWSADGLIVTTSHGVERDENLAVELGDGSRQSAALVGRDPDTDLALLRVAASGLPVLQPAGFEEVKVGHLVLAVARPGSGGLQATIGIISARMETERQGSPGFILHTDAVLYPGFSGGALADMNGRVAGLTNLAFGRGKGVAIGAPVVRQIAETLLAHGQVPRGYLGIRTQWVPLPEGLRKKKSLAQEHALLVVQVESDSPAEKGGLMLGDTLLTIAGEAVQDVEQLRRHLRGLPPGQTMALQVLRGGTVRDLTVTVGAA